MIQKIRRFVLVGMTGLAISVPALVPILVGGVVSADTPVIAGEVTSLPGNAGKNVASGLCEGVNSAANADTTNTCSGSGDTSTITNIAKTIVNILSIIIGVVAVIMIIIGGFRYVTSGGASEKVGGAKNTLIYAIIGLIIVALAQVIVHFVLTQANNGVTGTT